MYLNSHFNLPKMAILEFVENNLTIDKLTIKSCFTIVSLVYASNILNKIKIKLKIILKKST